VQEASTRAALLRAFGYYGLSQVEFKRDRATAASS
jgi:hypothetical protein